MSSLQVCILGFIRERDNVTYKFLKGGSIVGDVTNEYSYNNSLDAVVKGESKTISKYTKLLIMLFPSITFVGPFFSFMGIHISNLYSFILMIFVFNALLKKKYSYIWFQVSFFTLMIVYAFASLIWSDYQAIGLSIVLPLITCFTAMMFVASLDKKEFGFFLTALSYFTIFVLGMSLYEVFIGKYMFFSNVNFIYRTNPYDFNYPGVVFANPNDLAQYLIIGFPIMIFRKLEKGKNAFTPVLLLTTTIFVLINTYSRLAIISTFIIIAVYFSFSLNKKRYFTKKIIPALCIMIMIIMLLGSFEIELLNKVVGLLKLNTTAPYYTERSILYKNAYALGIDIPKNLLIGAGLGSSYAVTKIGTHNMFLFIFADIGIMFAIGFAFVLVYSFIKLLKYIKVKIYGCYLASIMVSMIIVFPLFSSMSSGNEQRKIVWIALGMIFATIKNYRKTSSGLKKGNN